MQRRYDTTHFLKIILAEMVRDNQEYNLAVEMSKRRDKKILDQILLWKVCREYVGLVKYFANGAKNNCKTMTSPVEGNGYIK